MFHTEFTIGSFTEARDTDFNFKFTKVHFLQSKYWRAVKETLGNKTIDADKIWFQTTKAPFLNRNIGYIPRAKLDELAWDILFQKAKEANCVYISIDPLNLKNTAENKIQNTKYTILPGISTHLQENVILDLQKDNEELLANMKQKHRYNLNLAKKKGVEIKINNSQESFEEFLKLYKATASRQNYFARSETYLRTVWDVLQKQELPLVQIATAYYESKPIASWFLFVYEDTIYYPYGGTSDENRNLMATYSLVWEIIQWGKENSFKYFDLWGIEKNSKGEYDGFSRFKLGFGGEHIEYADTLDLVIDKNLYKILNLGHILREKFTLIKKLVK